MAVMIPMALCRSRLPLPKPSMALHQATASSGEARRRSHLGLCPCNSPIALLNGGRRKPLQVHIIARVPSYRDVVCDAGSDVSLDIGRKPMDFIQVRENCSLVDKRAEEGFPHALKFQAGRWLLWGNRSVHAA